MLKTRGQDEESYIDERIDPGMDIIAEIKRLRKEKNALILAHYYQAGDIQDIADHVGDSLDLSRKAAEAEADIIVFAGVKFMAETAKILSPETKVLLPDMNAGCSLADTCEDGAFRKFLADNPGRTVITYVNSSAEIKALSDITCTSSNAYKIVESLPADEKIIFAPDRNLGSYIAGMLERDIILWEGGCHVHEKFSAENIRHLKSMHPEAKIIVHPECKEPVREMAEYIGSTGGLLRFIKNDNAEKYIIGTDPGIIHQMKKARPQKIFISAAAGSKEEKSAECEYMRLITLEKIYLTLKNEQPEILMERDLIQKAEKPIRRMLDISDRLGL